MESLRLKMVLGVFFLTLLRASFIRGNLAQQAAAGTKSEDYSLSPDYLMLKYFVDRIKTRISFGKDVAVYKWVNGEPILDKNREKFVLVNVEKTAKEMNKPYEKDDELFFIDLMEATKLIEYALVSDWYATESEGNTPAGSVSLDETRKKISGMQVELIELYFRLKNLQNSDNCQQFLAKAIFETDTGNDLLLRAVQRAFGNYCKKQLDHKSVNHFQRF